MKGACYLIELILPSHIMYKGKINKDIIYLLHSLSTLPRILMLHSLAQSLSFRGNKKIPIFVENQDFTLFCFSLLWCHQESNRGHKDFQSFRFYDHLKQASDGNQLSYSTLCVSFLSYECNFRSAVDIAVDKKSTKI